jgi:hypothetical protein
VGVDLFGANALDQSQQKDLIRQLLANLISSYADEADIFTELIQNAHDAVTLRRAEEPGYSGTVTIVVGRRTSGDDYLYVQDDGVGMTQDVAEKVFIPGYTANKKRGHTVGYKGVGMSYVVAVSNHLSLKTVKAGQAFVRTVRWCNDWVQSAEKPDPAIGDSFEAPAYVQSIATGIAQGTGVFFAFHAGQKPKDLKSIVMTGGTPEEEIDRWAGFLCAQTAIGRADPAPLHGTQPIKVVLHLDLDNGSGVVREYARSSFNLSEKHLGYPFPNRVLKLGSDTQVIDNLPPGQQHAQHYRQNAAVFHEWKGSDLIDATKTLDEEEDALVRAHVDWVYGFLCYSTDVMAKVREKLGTRTSVIRWGARLAVDGVPQGRALDLKLTSNQGLDRQTHIVIGVKQLDLDTGRKMVSDEKLLSGINKLAARVVGELKDYRWALKNTDRGAADARIADWATSVDSRAGNSPIRLLFERDGLTSPLLVEPQEEQEVVALWTGLLTGGFLPGYQTRAISGHGQYDSLVSITSDAYAETGELHPILAAAAPKANAVVEFKLMFEMIVADFDNGLKKPSEIDLVVCWDCPKLALSRGNLKPVYTGQAEGERPIRGASYIWTDGNSTASFPVIALRNVIGELLKIRGEARGEALVQELGGRDSDQMI